MKHRTTLQEELIDTICDDADDMVDFLKFRDDLEFNTGAKVAAMSEEEFRNTWNQYVTYQSVDDAVAEIEDGYE